METLVMLAFADAASPEGITWIAVQSRRGAKDLLKKTRLKLRGLQGVIKRLEAGGYLERIETRGKGCLWIVRPTPAGLAGVWGATPAGRAETPAEDAGETFNNRQDKENAPRLSPPVDKCPVSGKVLPPGLTLPQWEAFLDMRFTAGKRVAAYVAGVLLEKLTDIGRRWVAGDVVDRSTVNGWADLYEPEDGRITGVRRVVAGAIADPVGGLSDEDKAELARIGRMEDGTAQMEAKRLFFDRAERRNGPSSVGKLLGELNLGPPKGRRKKRG
jgi:hypothetical protein